MHMKVSQFTKIFAIAALLVSVAFAQQTRVFHEGDAWTEEVTGTLPAAKTLKVQVDFGSVRVQGSAQQDITYIIRTHSYTSSERQARREFEAYKINASSRGDSAVIEGNWEGGRNHFCSGEFVINVPRNLELAKLETSGGGVTVNGIGTVNGDLRLQTGGGRIHIANAKGKVAATTGGGNIMLVSAAQDATLEAGGGNIDVKQCGGKLKVSTGGGNIELGDIGGPVEMETGGGSIRLGWAKGVVRAETGAGRIELNNISAARAQTGAGGILAKFTSSGERMDSVLETSAGDIVVYIAPDVAMT